MPPLTIDLGDEQKGVDERLSTGVYETASEVLRAALRALDREETAFDDQLRSKVQAALNDPRPLVPASQVFERLERKHAGRMKVGGA